MWSRSTPSGSKPQDSTSSSHPASTTSASPPTFLANHHRTSSSTPLPVPYNDKGKSNSRSKTRKDELEDTFAPNDLAEDDDAWAEGSDDEAAFAALAAGGSGGGGNEKGQPVLSVSPPAPLTSPSSWSFNPFSIIAPSPKTPTNRPLHPVSSAGTVNGPEAVAAVLAGSAVRVVAPVSARVQEVAEAGSAKGAKEEGEEEVVKEVEEMEDPVEAEQRRARSRIEQCQAALKPNVEDLVKGTSSLSLSVPI